MPATRELTPPSPATVRETSSTLTMPASVPANAAAWLVALAVLIVPLVCAPDLMDRFRLIKESVTRAEAILGFLLVVATIVFGSSARLKELLRERALFGVAVAGMVWAAITTATSTHRLLSVDSLVTVLTSVILFLVIWFVAPRVGLIALDLLVPAVAVNVVIAALQEYSIYNPFKIDDAVSAHLSATGLIGNPNIVGSYAALVAVVLVAAATRVHRLRRAWYIVGALIAAAGVVVSDTETAVVTLLAGLFALAAGKSWKRAIAIGATLAVLVGIAALLRVPVMKEIVTLPQRIRSGGLESALSGRVAPSLVALQMTREKPVFGFGPGTYGFHFLPRRIALTENSGGAIGRGLGTNFAEVHNDHLQILAEAGIPAYLLFLAFVFLVVKMASKPGAIDERAEVVRAIAIPIAIALLVLCLAQFPLHVAATRHLALTIAGLIAGWSRL